MPRSQDQLSKIDPNAVPAGMERRIIKFLKHPEGRNGVIRYDAISLTLNMATPNDGPSVTNDKPIETFKGKWTGDPDKTVVIEEKFLNRDQPSVGTCSRPIKDQNMGCFAHNGCPYPDPQDLRGRGPGPFNVIIEKDGQRSSCPCYHAYHGVRRGLPTAQVHYLYSGHTINTDVTTIPTTKARMITDEWGNKVYQDVELEMPIDNLGPMYAHHFGKKKQKVKDEKPVTEREEMDEVVSVRGKGTTPNQSVKLS